MHVYVFTSIIAFFTKAFANPLPLDSVDFKPYLLVTLSNPFISDNLQTPSFPSIQVSPIWNSQYASTIDPSEPGASTDLAAVPCKIASTEQNDKDEICPIDAENQHKKGDELEQADPAVSNEPSLSDGQEDICENTDFKEHVCCDGPLGTPTWCGNKSCYSFIKYCLPCRSQFALRPTLLIITIPCARRCRKSLPTDQCLLQSVFCESHSKQLKKASH